MTEIIIRTLIGSFIGAILFFTMNLMLRRLTFTYDGHIKGHPLAALAILMWSIPMAMMATYGTPSFLHPTVTMALTCSWWLGSYIPWGGSRNAVFKPSKGVGWYMEYTVRGLIITIPPSFVWYDWGIGYGQSYWLAVSGCTCALSYELGDTIRRKWGLSPSIDIGSIIFGAVLGSATILIS